MIPRSRPLPPGVRIYDDVPWVEPAELTPRWWQRVLYSGGLIGLVAALGVMLAISIGLLMLLGFFLIDFLIS